MEPLDASNSTIVNDRLTADNNKLFDTNMLDVCQTWYDSCMTSAEVVVWHMPECPNCGRELKKTHRTALQKLLYSGAFVCPKCRFRMRRFRPTLRVNAIFVFSRYTHCINCGSSRVHRLSKRDRVDTMSHHVFSVLQHLTAAPLNKCTACRLQYYDWRPPKPVAEPDQAR
jgi:hypothetical protein